MKYLKSFAVAGMLALCLTSQAQQAKTEVNGKAPWSVRMAQSEMTRCPEAWQLDFVKSPKWGYCHGVVLCAMLNLYEAYGDKRYYDYAEQFCNTMVHDDGSITSYRPPTSASTSSMPACALPHLRPDAKPEIQESTRPPARTAHLPAPHEGRRLLAQAALHATDVARRHLHGIALLHRIHPPLRTAGRVPGRHPPVCRLRQAHLRPRDGTLPPRLGCSPHAALGRQEDRTVAPTRGDARWDGLPWPSSTCWRKYLPARMDATS